MASSGSRIFPARSGNEAAEARPGQPGQPGFDPGPLWMRLAPPLAMLAVAVWGIRAPSIWRDEGATLSAVQRPFSGLIRLLAHVDAVHGFYYVLLWPWVRLAGTSEFAIRLPSALAMVVTAAAIAAIGRRLISPRAGLAAGLVLAILPSVSRYAHDARPYAMVTALAAVTSYLLIRALGDPTRRSRWLMAYAGCLAVTGFLNILALLLVAAHAVTVAVACLRAGDRRAARSLALGWAAAAAAAIALGSLIVVMAWTERGQLGWLSAAGLAGANSLLEFAGTLGMTIIAVAIIAASIVLAARSASPGTRWPVSVPALCLPWLLVPPAVLLAASEITPVYTFRYVVFCIPAAALLVGAALAALPDVVAVTALVLLAALGIGAQTSQRSPGGLSDDIRQADQIVQRAMRPGDSVLYITQENYWSAYGYGLVRLYNVAQAETPLQSATLTGTLLPESVVRQRLSRVSRLWVMENHHTSRVPALQGLGLRRVREWRVTDIWLILYVQRPAG